VTSYGFRVYGIPKPQGSKIPGVSSKTGKMFVREQSGKGLTDWRQDVKEAALLARGVKYDVTPQADGVNEVGADIATFTGAVRLRVDFFHPRPASVPVKKRKHPTVAPDLDKEVRGVGDALKAAGVYKDDAQIIEIRASKRYVTDDPADSPGAWIVVSEVA
jgi:hypothetical protein